MTQAAKKPQSEPAVVVYGFDEDAKPRAALFKAVHARLATKAAQLMGLNALRLTKPAQTAAAERLPPGRIYANGRGLIPYVRGDLLRALLEVSGSRSLAALERTVSMTQRPRVRAAATRRDKKVAAAPAAQEAEAAPPGLPATWGEIAAGHLVIAQESPDDGWWEAIVISRDGDVLNLRWRDYPKYKPFVRNVATIALLNPTP